MIQLLVTLVVIGLIVYLLTTFVPMDPKIAQMIRIIALVICVLLALQAFGLVSGFRLSEPQPRVRVPQRSRKKAT